MRNKDYIVVHHSLTKDSNTVSWGAIRRYHTVNLGWQDVGYHYGIELVGDYYEILAGRMPNERGAHTKELDMNLRSIGICLVGDYDLISPPPQAILKLTQLIKYLQSIYPVPNNHIVGHREIGLLSGFDWTKNQYKTCPGRMFDMERLRSTL